jgi:two-component system, cell cycle response regulator DivK
LDLAMPGMNGFEITRQLRELPESEATFIVIVSGYCRPTDKAEALAAGANYFLAKPADPLALIELSETFGRRSNP